VIARITSKDPDEAMPPPELKSPLAPEQVALLKRWISEGAPYSGHWAFIAPKRPEVPDAPAGSIAHNPIDAFVLDRLSQEKLAASAPAPYDVLCRRIYLDLIGLPPSPQEIDTFIEAADKDLPSAVDALVDQLLESEHYGEKWARHWLDVARYADSNGYEKDLRREQWAWRDWVIGALNNDMPYDQFLIEQISGDLLPNRTPEQLIATGFLRNGLVNEEGAIVFEEFRMEGMFDRMDCVGKAVLGLSIQCAQCHSHKFDPISQDEYYGMFAFLNNTFEAKSPVYSREQRRKITEIETQLGSVDEDARKQHPNWQRELAAWEDEQRESTAKWEILDTTEQIWVGGLNHPWKKPDLSVVVLGHPSSGGDMYFVAKPTLDGITGLRLEALTYGDLPLGGPGRSSNGRFAVAELRVETRAPGSDEWVKVALQNATADFSEKEQPLATGDKKEEDKRRLGPVSFLIDGKKETVWRADRGPGRRNADRAAVVQFTEPLSAPEGTELKVWVVFQSGFVAPEGGSSQIGRTRLALTRSPVPTAPPYDHAATLALQVPAEERSPKQQATVFTAWRQSQLNLAKLNDRAESLAQQHPEAETSVLSVRGRSFEDRRETFVLDRGAWNKPTRKIAAHVPAVLHRMNDEALDPTTKLPDRLAFARWLADRKSPLTSRVQVNRVWQVVFGVGLVETPEDFGTRAPQPKHLKLLDWLAVEFIERDWSTKNLLRMIVGSATYQQDSRTTPAMLERDPLNQLFLRGPRFRAEAEVVRDVALSAAGILHRKVGGPSTFPPLPQSVLNDTFTRPNFWAPASGPERYRRALYIFRKRSMPDPVLTTFDAPNADFACARRVRSNTPLAALISLNEPIFVEAGRAMALRILREGGASDEERADYAFRLCTGRHARPAERAEILALLNDRRERLAEGWLSINEIATGDPAKKPEIPPNTTPQDAAAWTIVSRVILNLDETLSKN